MNISKLEGRTLNHYIIKEIITNNDIRYMPEEIKIEIIKLTPKCLGSIREHLYWIRHNLTEYPACKKCRNSLSSKQFITNKSGNGYREYCSKSCSRTTEDFKIRTRETSLVKYGVEHSFKLPEVQEKRKQTNLSKYGREHPHPWGSNEFKNNVLSKFNSIQEYIDFNRKECSNGVIKQYINSGRLNLSVQSIEHKFNVMCSNYNIIADESRFKDNILLSSINIEWIHNFCKEKYISPIINGEILVCPHCKKSGSSLLEQSILMDILLLSEINKTTVIHRDRSIITPKEIDILIPELKLGIEVNGLYWHNGERTGKNGFIEKSIAAQKQGIRLIHINEEQWVNKQNIIQSKLKYYFNQIHTRINARDCIIKEIDSKTKSDFLRENHLQGTDNSSLKFGLFKNDMLISVMTFGKSRFNKKYTWELIRFCSMKDIIVNGSFGKLFKYFIKNYLTLGDSVVSFRDLSWGLEENNIYTKNGFTFSHRSSPSYNYVSTNSPVYISRYKTQKHKLPKLLGDKFNPSLSESENMKILGYHKIYDCGNDVYMFNY